MVSSASGALCIQLVLTSGVTPPNLAHKTTQPSARTVGMLAVPAPIVRALSGLVPPLPLTPSPLPLIQGCGLLRLGQWCLSVCGHELSGRGRGTCTQALGLTKLRAFGQPHVFGDCPSAGRSGSSTGCFWTAHYWKCLHRPMVQPNSRCHAYLPPE